MAVERGADEEGFLAGHAEREAGHRTRDERHDDAHDRDGERGAPDSPQFGEVHLEADFEQQQDHTELGEGLECLAGVHPAEHRRSDDDTGDDLAHDCGETHTIRELGGDLCGQQDNENVEEDPVDVHAAIPRRDPDGPLSRAQRASGTRIRGSP